MMPGAFNGMVGRLASENGNENEFIGLFRVLSTLYFWSSSDGFFGNSRHWVGPVGWILQNHKRSVLIEWITYNS
jgi:hypothetical protein